MPFCSKCGAGIASSDKFCGVCGTAQWSAAGPLGPKTFGEILAGTIRLYGANFLGFVMIIAVVQVPLSIFGLWLGSIMENASVDLADSLEGNSSLDSAALIEILYVGGFLFITYLVAAIVMQVALIWGVSERILGSPLNGGRAYSFAMGRYGAMLGAAVLSMGAVFLMAVTVIGIPVAIYFAVRWTFIMQVASLERRSPLSALARSSELVRDNWWRVLGILVVVAVLAAIANGILSLGLGLIPYAGPVVAAVLIAPVMIIAQTLLYHDLRVWTDTPAGYNLEILAEELQR